LVIFELIMDIACLWF